MLKGRQLRPFLSLLGRQRRLRRSGDTSIRHRDAWEAAGRAAARRILLIRLDGLGDFILSLAGFRLFRDRFPAASLEILVGPWNVDLARMSGLFDAVHAFAFLAPPDGKGARDTMASDELEVALAGLDLGRFDIVADLRTYGSTRRVAAAIPAGFRAGFRAKRKDHGFDLLLPDFDGPEDGRNVHMSLRVMALAAAVAETFGAPAGRQRALDFLSERPPTWRPRRDGERVVWLNPFSGRLIKDWPVRHYAALIAALRQRGAAVHLFGTGPGDTEAARSALTGIAGVVDMGRHLPVARLIAELAEADLYVGNDSGTTHLAARLGVPTVAIMSGDVAPEVWRPLGAAVTVLRSAVPCAPCQLSSLQHCPAGHLCMETIPPAAVLAAVDERLSAPRLAPVPGEPAFAEIRIKLPA